MLSLVAILLILKLNLKYRSLVSNPISARRHVSFYKNILWWHFEHVARGVNMTTQLASNSTWDFLRRKSSSFTNPRRDDMVYYTRSQVHLRTCVIKTWFIETEFRATDSFSSEWIGELCCHPILLTLTIKLWWKWFRVRD